MKSIANYSLLLILLFLNNLQAQVPDSIPPIVLDFYDAPDQVHHQPNEGAPEETIQFGQLAGIWYCQEYMIDQDTKQLKPSSNAFWSWKYILDGYGVQDFWFQGENESPYWKLYQRDLMLTQIRIYDPKQQTWRIAWADNHAGQGPSTMFGLFTANAADDEIIMDFLPKEEDNLRRIVFSDIQQDSFEWRAERSNDQGKSWTVMSKISAVRLK